MYKNRQKTNTRYDYNYFEIHPKYQSFLATRALRLSRNDEFSSKNYFETGKGDEHRQRSYDFSQKYNFSGCFGH